MTLRVHELAKELKLSSKELIDKLKALKIDAKSHMSVLTEEQVRLVKSPAKSAAPAAPAPAAKREAAPPAAPPAAAAQPAKGSSPAASSIENAKKELMLQRGSVKAAQAAAPPPVKRPIQSSPSVNTPPAVKRPSAVPMRPAPDVRRPVQTAVSEPSAAAPQAAPAAPPVEVRRMKSVELAGAMVVKDLAAKLGLKPSDVIQRLIKQNIFASINQTVNFEVASKIASEAGFEVEKPAVEKQEEDVKATVTDKTRLKPRAPIVTFMGHVDHGKTSLLDAIRKTKVAAGEAGGITQHIGAYEVFLPKGAVTFLDTPGHEAFTAMRARGAKATDVVVHVVAADDGVMPQTIEAIDHAKAANVPIIVAINKIDLPSANPDRAKKSLSEHGLLPEDWGGKTVMLGVSAKTGQGIDELLEMLALESELLELKADPDAPACGVVVEAELSKESGVLATVLVQEGTLRVGDTVVVGTFYCKVRAMINDRGQRIKEAPPSMPVEILGLPGVPKAGDRFRVVKDERAAKEITEKFKIERPSVASHVSLEHIFEDVKSGKVEELKLIIKSDVQGSVEALRSTLGQIKSTNVRLSMIHTGIGDITESDVMLAAASEAVVIGFHVDIVGTARDIAEREGVDVRFYQIIYEVKTAIEKAMEGLLEPELKEVFVGVAEVRQVFKVSKKGTIAGCSVQKGKIVRNFSCRVMRDGKKVSDGKIESLKRFKDDAREVLEGFECGIGVSNFDDILVGDRIEVYEIQQKARKLE
ncbi:MAG TPA: translation initiation factor IF-2 [Candidatus Eisenbacteria bacterium]|nr:translation initiation factor IF-2 [Candidatus Eisenbacteria bacterium]